jgi:D-proline reductase (dithiol) PrdB
MARLEDIPQPSRDAVVAAPCPAFETQPFVGGPPLAQRRVAIVSSAALIRRGDKPFPFGSAECRFLPAALPAGDLLTSHASINFDRAGFQRDLNVVYPIDRLRELAAEGVIGGAAETHFTVMGSTDPAGMMATADQIAGQLRQERIDSILLSPAGCPACVHQRQSAAFSAPGRLRSIQPHAMAVAGRQGPGERTPAAWPRWRPRRGPWRRCRRRARGRATAAAQRVPVCE